MLELLDQNKTFHLQTKETSLVYHVLETGYVTLVYWGKKINSHSLSYVIQDIKRASYLSDTDGIKDFKLEQIPQAYPGFGNTDLRTPAFELLFADGSRLTQLRYKGHYVEEKKQPIPGLPTTIGEDAKTVVIEMTDDYRQIKVSLHVSLFFENNVITQHVSIENQGDKTISIEKMMSINIDFLNDNFDYCYLSGAWGREAHRKSQALAQGSFKLDSKRGASGHGQNPFISLASKGAKEDYGELYSLNLVYSGSFEASVEVDMHQNSRMQIGINNFDFSWELHPETIFYTPEVVMVYSDQGYNKLSHIYHDFYRQCLLPKSSIDRELPVAINNWEVTYFDFNKDKLLGLAEVATKTGIDLFVLDDGWFGKREDVTSSLGDWAANEEKLGGKLSELIEGIHDLNLDFGLWLEPEMVSPDSDLFRAHPDWIIHVPGYEPQISRHQYVLDLANEEVQNYLISTLTDLFTNNKIDYVKWDMNRNITDSGSSYLGISEQRELGHRYILGLYRILDVITTNFPHILFESCAGGGGRYDPGMLHYMPLTWVSDGSDPIERLPVQFGTSLIYPPSTMSCHVSETPNHQMGRFSPLDTRHVVAMQGSLGYELNLVNRETSELDELKGYVDKYKSIRQMIKRGQFTRLTETDDSNHYSWQFISEDRQRIFVSYVQLLAKGNTVPKRLRLKELEEEAIYEVNDQSYYGSELMSIGLSLEKVTHDFYAMDWEINKL